MDRAINSISYKRAAGEKDLPGPNPAVPLLPALLNKNKPFAKKNVRADLVDDVIASAYVLVLESHNPALMLTESFVRFKILEAIRNETDSYNINRIILRDDVGRDYAAPVNEMDPRLAELLERCSGPALRVIKEVLGGATIEAAAKKNGYKNGREAIRHIKRQIGHYQMGLFK